MTQQFAAARLARVSKPSPRHADGTQREDRPYRIAVAEDDADFRAAVATRLRLAGYVVTELHDGRELLDALEWAPRGFFDLVIADHWMPRMRGVEVLASAGAHAPFVIVSGADFDVVQASAEKFGAAAILAKPVDLALLVDVVRVLLEDN